MKPADFTFKRPEIIRSDEEIRKWEWKNEVLPRLREVGLESRFHQKIEWDRSCPLSKAQERVFMACRRLLVGNGSIIALVGNRGAGKTTLAAQLIIERAMEWQTRPERWSTPYEKLTDLIARFKPIYADFGGIDNDRLTRKRDKFCSYPLRVIDEIHDCDDMKMKGRLLTDIIDRCYSKQVDTVLISNQTVQAFKASIGDSILSRLEEHGAIIPCEWGSFRAKSQS